MAMDLSSMLEIFIAMCFGSCIGKFLNNREWFYVIVAASGFIGFLLYQLVIGGVL